MINYWSFPVFKTLVLSEEAILGINNGADAVKYSAACHEVIIPLAEQKLAKTHATNGISKHLTK